MVLSIVYNYRLVYTIHMRKLFQKSFKGKIYTGYNKDLLKDLILSLKRK